MNILFTPSLYTGFNYIINKPQKIMSAKTLEQAELLILLNKIDEGCERSFKTLYEKTSGVAYAIALKMIGSPTAAQEVVQEAYIKVWTNAGRYQPDKGAALPWVLSIVRYRAIDLLRSEKRRVQSLSEHTDVSQIADIDGASDSLSISEDLQRCLKTLASSQRRNILQTFFFGLTYKELSNQRSMPLGTLKSQIRRGLTRLRRCLNNET